MKMMTAAIKKALPKLYAQDGKGMDAVVHVKYFNPCGSQTWFITEGEEVELDNGTKTFHMFGYVTGMGGDEFGYVMLNELEKVRVAFGLSIERDMHFIPKPLSECVKK
jgi:hypothetical protein